MTNHVNVNAATDEARATTPTLACFHVTRVVPNGLAVHRRHADSDHLHVTRPQASHRAEVTNSTRAFHERQNRVLVHDEAAGMRQSLRCPTSRGGINRP
jgi:hypothetical protein